MKSYGGFSTFMRLEPIAGKSGKFCYLVLTGRNTYNMLISAPGGIESCVRCL